MKDTMGLILAMNESIPPVTNSRAALALPIAGRYRIIDFVLSNMANSGITNIGVATKENYSSLMEHIKSGSPWDLDRKNQGLNLLPPNIGSAAYSVIRGDIDMLFGVRDYIRSSPQKYVILSFGSYVYNIDFDTVVAAHKKNDADITAVYKNLKDYTEEELSRFVLFDVDSDGRVTDLESRPNYPKTTNACMDLYVINKSLLENIIDECSSRGNHDFVKDALSQKLSRLKVCGYEYKGYAGKIDSLRSYFSINMSFLDAETRNELFNPENPIYTKTRDQPPARYGSDATVENSFISDGCVIEGTVINCVLSRAVKVAKGAILKNSIIMQDSIIEAGAALDYVFFDKQVHITKGRRLLGQESYPLAIAKGTEI